MSKILPLILLMTASSAFSAEIYKWKDKNGAVHYSDKTTGQIKYEQVNVKINTYTHVTYQRIKPTVASGERNNKRVVMYGTSWCGYCKKARAYFRSRNIEFSDLDVETDASAKAQFNSIGGGGVPVILIGETRINGFNENEFERIFKRS